jgi:hypothetical protein
LNRLMTILKVNLVPGGTTGNNWNDVSDLTTSLSLNVLDSTGSASGITLSNLLDYSSTVYLSAAATGDTHGWEEAVWDRVWRVFNAGDMSRLSGLTSGDDYTLTIAGANLTSGENTTFDASGSTGSALYTTATSAPPNSQVVITGTVPADGNVDINMVKSGSFAYCTGFVFEYTAAGGGDNVTVTDLTEGKIYQRESSANSKSIAILGTYSGTPTNIQARIVLNGTSTESVTWTTIDASPSSNAFSGSITVPASANWYNVQVRYSNDTSIVSNGSNAFGVGDLWATIGQSNTANWYVEGSGQSADNRARRYDGSWSVLPATSNGATAFVNNLLSGMSSPVLIGLVDAAVNGTSLLEEADGGSGYWSNELTTSSRYATFLARVTNVGGGLAGVYFGQGERDARSTLVTEAEYAASLSYFITSQIRADIDNKSASTNLPFMAALLGFCTDTGTDPEWQGIRNAQSSTMLSVDDCYIASTTIDLAMADAVHRSAAGYTIEGQRAAQTALLIYGDQTYNRGPSITSFADTSTTTTNINLAHQGGSDFTPTTGITGFEVLDDGTPVTISSAVRSTATRITLTHAAISGTKTARSLYGANPVVTNPVYGNAALALPAESRGAIAARVATATIAGITGGESLSGLSYCVFNGYDISADVILKQGAGETTDSSGDLVIDLASTAIENNDPVTIIISDYTNSPTGSSSAAVCYTTASVS